MNRIDDLEKTFVAPVNDGIDFSGNLIVIFDGNDAPRTVDLSDYMNCDEVTISRVSDPQQTTGTVSRGRDGAVVYVTNRLVSRRGSIHFIRKNQYWKVRDDQERLHRGDRQLSRAASLLGADLLKITNDNDPDDVFLMIAYSDIGGSAWKTVELNRNKLLRIGRDDGESDVVLPDINVSRNHAELFYDSGRDAWCVKNRSDNGTFVNTDRIEGDTRLYNKDVIQIGKTHFVLIRDRSGEKPVERLFYHTFGNSIEARGVVVRRGSLLKGVKTRTNRVNMKVNAGELVAIVGGSGAGKSTLLNCMCGYLKPAEGHVLVNGVDLYEKYKDLRHLIGYVPQSDIVYDQLTVEQMLRYSARLRLPETVRGAGKKDVEQAVTRALSIVELTHKRNAKIGELSGGQRKRASIAVELLANPDILFLDEPTSGLDPQTEKELMNSLRRTADAGKAVILVTHSTLQLKMCDKVAFVGPGGHLRFYGPLDAAFEHFGTDDIVRIFEIIEHMKPGQDGGYAASPREEKRGGEQERKLFGHHQVNRLRQFPVLLERNFALLFSSLGRSLLTVLSFLLPALIVRFILPKIVTNKALFVEKSMHPNAALIMYLLACTVCFFVTLMSSTQICKEFTVLKREKMAGESLIIYYLAKIVCLCLLDAAAAGITYFAFVSSYDMPDTSHVWSGNRELFFTMFLMYLAFTTMGLLISALVTKPEATSTASAFVLISQVLLSGILLKLTGVLNRVKQIILCYHCSRALGFVLESHPYAYADRENVDFTTQNLEHEWIWLGALSLAFAVLTVVWLTVNLKTEVSKPKDRPGLLKNSKQ